MFESFPFDTINKTSRCALCVERLLNVPSNDKIHTTETARSKTSDQTNVAPELYMYPSC